VLCALLAKEEARVKDVQRVHGEHDHGTVQYVYRSNQSKHQTKSKIDHLLKYNCVWMMRPRQPSVSSIVR
jgi:hypothetical protein